MAKAPATNVATPANKAPVEPRLRVIPEDETFKRETRVEGRSVHLKRAVKASDKAKHRYEVQTTLDFKDCSMEEILTLAADTVYIDVQRIWRTTALGKDAAKAYDAKNWAYFNVKVDILDVKRERTPVDPVLAARRALEKLGFTAEQVEETLKNMPAAPAS